MPKRNGRDDSGTFTDALHDRAGHGQLVPRSRRHIQGAVVRAVGLIWFVAVTAACCSAYRRRRRYLPMIVIVLTLGAYAAIRVVYQHQMDAILDRRQMAGLRYGTAIECTLSSRS